MRLRREMGLKCKTRKKFRASISSNHKLPAAPDLLKQKFDTEAPIRGKPKIILSNSKLNVLLFF